MFFLPMSVAISAAVSFCIAFTVSAVGGCGVPGFGIEVRPETQIHPSVEELLCQYGVAPETVYGPFLLLLRLLLLFLNLLIPLLILHQGLVLVHI